MGKIRILGGAALSGLAATAAFSQEMPPLDPVAVEAGASIYRQYCGACHGVAGEGAPGWQQPNAEGELPPPPHDQTGHTWRHSDAALYDIVVRGWRDPFNRTDRLTMPPFGQVLAPEDVRAVLTFLKSLWTPEQRQYQLEQSRTNPFPVEAR